MKKTFAPKSTSGSLRYENIIFFQFSVNLPAVLVVLVFFFVLLVFSLVAVTYYVYTFLTWYWNKVLEMAGGNKRFSRNNSNFIELPQRGPGGTLFF